MPNTGEDREIIHIQAPTIHKVFTAYISILWGLGLNLGAPGFASLQITCQNLVDTSRILENVCYGDWQETAYTYKSVYNWKHFLKNVPTLYLFFCHETIFRLFLSP
jgi:hypothetical protein